MSKPGNGDDGLQFQRLKGTRVRRIKVRAKKKTLLAALFLLFGGKGSSLA